MAPICLVNTTGSSTLGKTAQYHPQDAESRGQRRRTVLCVDDDPVVLCLQRVLLEAAGFVVTIARDPSEALHEFSVRTPDAVVLDYAMPGTTGAALALRLRRLNRDVPLVLNTGCASVPARDAAQFDRVLPKGLAPRLLVATLREMLCPPVCEDDLPHDPRSVDHPFPAGIHEPDETAIHI